MYRAASKTFQPHRNGADRKQLPMCTRHVIVLYTSGCLCQATAVKIAINLGLHVGLYLEMEGLPVDVFVKDTREHRHVKAAMDQMIGSQGLATTTVTTLSGWQPVTTTTTANLNDPEEINVPEYFVGFFENYGRFNTAARHNLRLPE